MGIWNNSPELPSDYILNGGTPSALSILPSFGIVSLLFILPTWLLYDAAMRWADRGTIRRE